MVNQDLLAIFVALAALAVVIQTGILAGFYFLTRKMSAHANRSLSATRRMVDPIQNIAENLQSVTALVEKSFERARRRPG